jgi:hypothetical protein
MSVRLLSQHNQEAAPSQKNMPGARLDRLRTGLESALKRAMLRHVLPAHQGVLLPLKNPALLLLRSNLSKSLPQLKNPALLLPKNLPL